MHPIIDAHSHFFPEPFLDALQGSDGAGWLETKRDGKGWLLARDGGKAAPLEPVFFDVEARLRALDELGFARQALSLSPPMLYQAADKAAVRLARVFNDGLAEVCWKAPARLIGQATLPLQDVAASIAEMERATRDLGLRGIYIGSNVRGDYLDGERFWPLYEAAESLNVPIFTHPVNTIGEKVMAARYYLQNAVGNPTETAFMAVRLILTGVLERFPNLKIVLAHGGGALPLIIGRVDHNYRARPECRNTVPHPPSAYMRRMYYDTITHDDTALRYLIELVGHERVLLGTDYPYNMADNAPQTRLARLRLDAVAQAAIVRGNAQMLLAL